jgi:hypothetical protein
MLKSTPTEGHELPGEAVRTVLGDHEEALILVLDPDPESEGESKISCFLKTTERSRLSAYLPRLLEQLLKTCDKSGGNVSTQTAIGS